MSFRQLQQLDRILYQRKPTRIGQQNKSLNRYNDVLPYDETLCQLPDQYVNANYVEPIAGALDGPLKEMQMPGMCWEELRRKDARHYIATQAPTKRTIGHFIRLVLFTLENSSANIVNVVMLTEWMEGVKVKADNYLDQLNVSFGCEPAVEHIGLIDKRTWVLPSGKVVHWHLRDWIDHASPPVGPNGEDVLLGLVNMVQEGEMIVHCSAGVGRTGTFIALDYMIKENRPREELFNLVWQLKCARMLMVQTESQYEYLKGVL